MKKLILSLAILFTGGFALQSQAQQFGPEWGEKPEDRMLMVRAYNFLGDNVRGGNYGKAAYYLQQLLEKAPTATIHIYVQGINLYKARIDKAADRTEKMAMLDSLMIVYDLGIANMSEKDPGTTTRFKQLRAYDYMEYNPMDRQGIAERFRQAITEMGDEVDPDLILIYFNELTTDFKNDDVSTADYLAEFDRLGPIMAQVGTEEKINQLQQIFGTSGAADCTGIEALFGPQIEAEPENAELLEKTVALLNNAGCAGTDFYLRVAELYYKVQPSSTTALILASSYMAKGNNAVAKKYFEEALSGSSDPTERAGISLSIAVMQLNERNYRDAYNYARQAIQSSTHNAQALYVIAMSYAGGASAVQDVFTRQTVYWLVVDNLQNARRVVASSPGGSMSVADLDKSIAQFQASFPTVEELFFQGLDEGASYTVNAGWISGQTTVRRRP